MDQQTATQTYLMKDYTGPSFQPIGIPSYDPMNALPMGLPTPGILPASPQIMSNHSMWEDIKQDSLSAVSWAEDAVKKVYHTGRNAVDTVVGDAIAPVENRLNSIYWYSLGAIVVVGLIIIYAGKTGAVRTSVVI